jgi:hypothetical protein
LDITTEGWRNPTSLRVIAFGFTLFGVLSVLDMLLKWTLFGMIYVNIGVVALFIGSGLRKWRASSRWWAVFWSWLAIIFIIIWMPLALFVMTGGVLPRGITVQGGTLQYVLFAICLLGYLIWQLQILRRHEIVERFEAARLIPDVSRSSFDSVQQGRWRFSLQSLLMGMVVAAFVLARFNKRKVL